MGTSGFILKNRLEYSVEAMMGSIMIAVFKADITISFGGEIFNNDDGSFCYSTMSIFGQKGIGHLICKTWKN